ncbi:oxaloacetate decarboxylase [Bradyrhizobium diazoefficiens]|nr:oxaloacetate decarboxylase [Bradyrhizobium diazoefficiens]
MKRANRLRLTPGAGIVSVGVSDALTARIAEQVGYESVFVTGAGISNTHLGMPDMGFVSFKELLDQVYAIRDAISIPLGVDGDTGFGNAVNVGRTVRLLERAGASSISLEDQVSPKRCGHFAGKAVIPASEMVQKIKAALDARVSPDTLISARTDARAVEGLDRALERAQLYKEAGADTLFVESPISVDELARIPASVPGVHSCNMVIGGKTPVLERQQLADMGYATIAYANAALQASAKAIRDVFIHLKTHGSINGFEDRVLSFEERQKVVDRDHYYDLEARYASDDGDATSATHR